MERRLASQSFLAGVVLVGWLAYGLMWGQGQAPEVAEWVKILAWVVHMISVCAYTFWRAELAKGTMGWFLWVRVVVIVATCCCVAFVPINLAHFMSMDHAVGLTLAYLVIWYFEMILCGVLHPESTTDEYLAVIGISILRSEGVFVVIATTVIIMIRVIDFARVADFRNIDRAVEKAQRHIGDIEQAQALIVEKETPSPLPSLSPSPIPDVIPIPQPLSPPVEGKTETPPEPPPAPKRKFSSRLPVPPYAGPRSPVTRDVILQQAVAKTQEDEKTTSTWKTKPL